MSAEKFDPEKLKGVSIRTILETQTNKAPHFSSRIQERFSSLEQEHISPEGEPTLLYNMATAVTEGASLRSIAVNYGLTHKLLAELLQAASIPYATREQAVQRLWNDPQFREKNNAAQTKVRGKYWEDPEKRESVAAKLRMSALKQWEDPNFRELVVSSSSETSKQRWQDPEYRRIKTEQIRQVFAEIKADPDYHRLLSEARRKQWEDPEFRDRNIDISRSNLAGTKQTDSYRGKQSALQRQRWSDPEYRKKMLVSARRTLTELWKDPDYLAAAVARGKDIMTRLNKDPNFREKSLQNRRERMMDPEYRDQISETRRQIALTLWENPEYRTKLVDIHKAQWQDPEYRDNQGAAVREARLDPANRDRFVLPTIHGFRSDLGFYAQSAWEANVARVFQLIGREFEVGVNLPLEVTNNFQELFQAAETTLNVDFSTVDRRGRRVMYELMAHPLEYPDGWAKLVMAREQYPDIVINAVDERFYERLQSRFEIAINTDPQFRGWERSGFNLRTHPEVFG